MNCLICRQAELVPGFTSIQFERRESRYTIHHVPARMCTVCNEAYVDENVADALLGMADEVFASGVLDCVIEYNISN